MWGHRTSTGPPETGLRATLSHEPRVPLTRAYPWHLTLTTGALRAFAQVKPKICHGSAPEPGQQKAPELR